MQKKIHTLSLGGCGGQGCYFQPNPRVISQMSASHECTDTVQKPQELTALKIKYESFGPKVWISN